MKELSIEEKAKAYDEVRDKIALRFGTNVAKEIFSQFEESDNERIRKALIKLFKTENFNGYVTLDGIDIEDVLTWLEKHGEQKSIDEIAKEVSKDKTSAVAFLKGTGIMNEKGELADEYKIEQDEQNSTWSEEDEDYYDAIISKLEVTQDDALLTDNQMKFLKSLKDRVHPQPKQEWSEEDYNEIETIACHLDNTDNEGLAEVLRNIRDKYYHIIPQNTWKPSDEQMEGIECTIKTLRYQLNAGDNRLDSLYNDLKKLRGK